MKILITGATGFIGKNLLKYIKENGIYSDTDIVILSSQDVLPYKCINHKKYSFTKKDFYKNSVLKIDVVIHMGAFIPKASIEANAVLETVTNINNTVHVLANLPNIPRKFIFLSTIDVYKNTNEVINENTDTIPNTLYGCSKLICEKIVFQTAKQNGFIPQILRIGHIYGPGEEEYKKLIPETIKKVINNETPVIFSNGSEKRSFLYIDDCCKAIINAVNLEEYVGPINVVSNRSVKIKKIVQMIIDISKKDIYCEIQNREMSVRSLVFSNDKMEKHLCSEEVNLYDGLQKEYIYLSKILNV